MDNEAETWDDPDTSVDWKFSIGFLLLTDWVCLWRLLWLAIKNEIKKFLQQNVFIVEHRYADRVGDLWLYVHDLCMRVMPFLQTRPDICCNLEYFVAWISYIMCVW